MDARETLERRIDELCRENEQLRQQVASIIDRSFRTADKMECLNVENAKLRQLLIDLKCAPCCGDKCWMHLPERLIELGILEEA